MNSWQSVRAALALMVFLGGQLAGVGRGQEESQKIRRAIAELAAPVFAVRERATRTLWKFGMRAAPALEQAARSDDPEVAYRANAILREFRLGILPNTPPEIAARIRAYVEAVSRTDKSRIIRELQSEGHHQAAYRLVMNDQPPSTILIEQLVSTLTSQARTRIAVGDFAEAERLLWQAALTSQETAMQDYVVALHVTERLPAALARWQALADGPSDQLPEDLTADLLVRLRVRGHRLAGDLARAAELAQTVPQHREELFAVLFARRDWPALYRAFVAERPRGSTSTQAEWLGFAATYAALANETEQHQQYLKELRELGLKSSSADAYCIEALLINERYDEAIEVAKNAELQTAFALLAGRGQWDEAFKLLGCEDLQAEDRSWIDEAIKPNQSKQRYLALEACKELKRLGRPEDALRLFQHVAQQYQSSSTRALTLAGYATTAELFAEADRWAGEYLEKSSSASSVLRKLYPTDFERAELWWEFVRRYAEDRPHSERLGLLRQVVAKEAEQPLDADQWTELLEAAREYSPDAVEAARPDANRGAIPQTGKWLAEVARTALKLERDEFARSCLQSVADVESEAALLMGDLEREAEELKAASRWYQIARQRDPSNSLAHYLHSVVLEAAGEREAARRARRIAECLPLGTRDRQKLSDGLRERDLIEHAHRQWQIGNRSHDYLEWYAGNSAMHLGNYYRNRDSNLVSEFYYEYWLGKLSRTRSYTEIGYHYTAAKSWHKYRALAALDHGPEIGRAVRELQRAIAISPGDLAYVRSLVFELHRRDMRGVADQLFAEAFAKAEAVCRKFPQSAELHHDLAWTAAYSQRELERGEELARKAIQLAPEKIRYQATLAELRFQQGHVLEAIELADACLDKQPHVKFYQTQRERYGKHPQALAVATAPGPQSPAVPSADEPDH